MEEYAVAELAASADAVMPGLGLLAAALAGLAGSLTGPQAAGMTFGAAGERVTVQGRELLRMVVQLVMDDRAAREVRLAQVTDAQGVPRRRAERGHARTVTSSVGPVTVTRIAYRAPGAVNLHPADAVLSLPPRRQSWQVQRTIVEYALAGSYEQAQRFLLETTGVRAGKLQLEQIVLAAARDAPAFYQLPAGDQDAQDGRDGGLPAGVPLVISADGKGVAMRPEGRRAAAARRAGRHVKAFGTRLGTGEKAGQKRMAETGVVFDALPPPGPARTPDDIMSRASGEPGRGPEAANRWYAIDITAGRGQTIRTLSGEAGRRDPGHDRTWVALADGDRHQIELIRREAAERDADITILVDFIHVLEYLWKAAWAFHPARDPAAETWVTEQALAILRGQTAGVIATIGKLAGASPPKPGGEHEKQIRKALHYLTAKAPYLDYPRALAAGWPIATGVIEGACRHLVADRMGITGARWGLPGAQAILWLRAIRANGDLDAYWNHHTQQEHRRNHLSRYQAGQALAA